VNAALEWEMYITQVTSAFSRKMCETLSIQTNQYSLGMIGITCICSAMALKMDILKQDKATVIRESLEFLESVSSKTNITLLANVNFQLDSFTRFSSDENADSEATMNRINSLIVECSNSPDVKKLNPAPIDCAVVWFIFGIGSFIKSGVYGESHSFSILKEVIKTIPFDEIDRVH
jgi:hypothetical protein